MPLRFLTGLLCGALLTACLGGEPGGPPTGVRMAVTVPGAVNITSLELIVLDGGATCVPPDATGGREVMRTSLVPGESRELQVSSGMRTFSVIANDGDTPVARGCDSLELVAGQTHQVDIQLVEYPPDVDAGPGGCDGAQVLSDGVSVPGTLVGATDNGGATCATTGAADLPFQLTVPAGADRRVRVTVSGATFDPALHLHGITCDGAELHCVESGDGDREVLDIPGLAPGDYWVWVEADSGDPGTFDILFELLPDEPVPGNDMCSAPEALTVDTVDDSNSTVAAGDDYDLACLSLDGPDTVHQIDLAADQAVLIEVTPSPGWALAAELRGQADCAAGPEVSCVADLFPVRYINRPTLTAGIYDLIVDGSGGAAGDYDVVYRVRPPDATFGYWPIDTTGNTYGSIAGLTGSTQLTIPLTVPPALSPGDEWSLPITLPFTFPFFTATYTVVNVSSNGYLTFTGVPATAASYSNDCPLDGTTPNDMLALFWDDGISTTTGPSEMWTRTEGIAPARRFVVEFVNWDVLDCGGGGMCDVLDVQTDQQAIFYENGDIEFRYGPRQAAALMRGCDTQHNGCSATIGIEAQAPANDADQIQCNTSNVVDGRAIYFVRPR